MIEWPPYGPRYTLRLMPLVEATKADEVMITCMIFDHAARKRSYELLADAFALNADAPALTDAS